MGPPPHRTRSLWHDRSGSVAVTTVLVGSLMFGMAALVIDVSRFYLLKRQQQTVTDLAAAAAAANIAHASAAAAANLLANGVPAANLASVDVGTYAANPAVAAGQRFTVGSAATANAARVTLRSSATAFFGRFVSAGVTAIGTRSVAVNTNTAAFALRSAVAGTDSGLANGILGGLMNATLNLSSTDYAALSAAGVDLFGLANALAQRIGTTGTYASVAATSVRLADVLNAAADAASAGGASAPAVAALRAMAMAAGPSGPKLTFGSLVGFGAYGALPLGSAAPVAAALPVLALVSAAARLGAGTVVVSNALGATTSPILGATVRLAVAQPGAGSTYAAIGPLGTTLHTAETRVMLTLNLAGLGTVTGLNLPLSMDVGPATASITAIGCSAGAPVDPAVTLGVTPGLVDGWIGTVSDAALADLTTPLNPSAAVLTNLGVVSVSGRAHATVSNTGQTAVPFTSAEIAAGTMKSTGTTDDTASLLSQLIGSLQLNANLLGASVPLPLGAGPSISALLQADLQPIDRELSGTLAMLGVTIGDADTWVRAVRCGGGALVN